MRLYAERSLIENTEPITHHQPSITVYTWVRDVVLPGGALAAAAVFADKEPKLVVLFLIATIALSTLGLAPRLWRWSKRWRAQRQENLLAARELPKFQELVHRFGDFANNRTNDTLQGIIREFRSPAAPVLTKYLDPHSIQLWDSLWTFFRMRVDRQPATLPELRAAAHEFNNLYGQYFQWCVAPIFEYHAEDIRAVLSAEERAKLNRFCRELQAFRTAYVQFMKSFCKTHPSCEHLPYPGSPPTEL